MGGGARETLTGGKGVVEGGEAAAGVQQRRRLHREAPEKRTPPETAGQKHRNQDHMSARVCPLLDDRRKAPEVALSTSTNQIRRKKIGINIILK